MVAFLSKKQMRMVMALLAANKKSLKKSEEKGVGIIVAIPDGRVLVGRSSAYKDGQWSLPGGKVEPGESFDAAAVRELEEETGLKLDVKTLTLLENETNQKSYFVKLNSIPQVKINTKELQDIGFYYISDLLGRDVRSCCLSTIKEYGEKHLAKSKKLCDMVATEELKKNIIRSGQVADAVFEVSHGDALRLVGNGTFRILREATKEMTDDSIKSMKFGPYNLHIRKHCNDIYSGRIDDGLKTIHQFVNRSIPTLTAEVMSVFEWYDDDFSSKIEPKLEDSVITDGVQKLAENYTKHNITNIYEEIESVREEIRSGVAIDLQQAEQKILKIFDRLESTMGVFKDKHNILASEADKQLEDIELKLRKLQAQIDKIEHTKISSKKECVSEVHRDFSHLSKPRIEIEPSGKISISFSSDWDREAEYTFLKELKQKNDRK